MDMINSLADNEIVNKLKNNNINKPTIFLDGPRPRFHELKFAWGIFLQFIKSYRTLTLLALVLQYLVAHDTKKMTSIIRMQWNLANK